VNGLLERYLLLQSEAFGPEDLCDELIAAISEKGRGQVSWLRSDRHPMELHVKATYSQG
jgi:hypothetical protein